MLGSRGDWHLEMEGYLFLVFLGVSSWYSWSTLQLFLVEGLRVYLLGDSSGLGALGRFFSMYWTAVKII